MAIQGMFEVNPQKLGELLNKVDANSIPILEATTETMGAGRPEEDIQDILDHKTPGTMYDPTRFKSDEEYREYCAKLIEETPRFLSQVQTWLDSYMEGKPSEDNKEAIYWYNLYINLQKYYDQLLIDYDRLSNNVLLDKIIAETPKVENEPEN